MKKKNQCEGMQLFLFPEYEDELIQAQKTEIEAWSKTLPHFINPKNENEELLEFQYQYKNGNPAALDSLFKKAVIVCLKFIGFEAKNNKAIRKLTSGERSIKATDAAMYLIERALKDERFAVTSSYTGYLYLRVKYELYHQREVDKIVDFVDLDEFHKDNEDAFLYEDKHEIN